MRYNMLGQTGLFVSELCLGTMTFGENPGMFAAASGVGQQDADRIVQRCIEAGINFFDTADVYAAGQSEAILGRAIRNAGVSRDNVVIATKVGSQVGAGPNDGGLSRHHIMAQAKASLKNLGVDHLDLLMLHHWDPATPIEESIQALDDLVRAGDVRYAGISNFSAWQTVRAAEAAGRLGARRFASYQGYYSLVDRAVEREVVPVLEAEQASLIVYSPLASGYLTGKYRDGVSEGRRSTLPFPFVDEAQGGRVLDVLAGIAAEHNVSFSAVALAWVLGRKAVASVLLGIKREEQLSDNLASVDVRLTAQNIADLDQASEQPAGALSHEEMVAAPRRHLMATGTLIPQPGV